MAEAEYEKTSYGTFEKFFYLFFIPVIFTAILSFVLLSVFDYNVMNTALKLGNKIPFVEKIIPDPETAAEETEEEKAKREVNVESLHVYE